MTIQLAATARNALLDAAFTTALGNAALLRIYSGTPPANVAASLSGNTLLAELVCGSPFGPSASGGVLSPTLPTQDSSADATGTATFFRIYQSNGTTAIVQGSVATSGADLNLVTTSIVAGQPVLISAFALTAPGA